jgi:hypothetical protein
LISSLIDKDVTVNTSTLSDGYILIVTGSVEIPAADMSTSNPVEKWYTLNSPSANRKSGGSEAVVLRVKTRYQSVPILPVAMYEELVDVSTCKVLV